MESPPLTQRFRDSLVYAAKIHGRQVRKGGREIPYIGHLLIVAGTVIEWGGDEDMAIAAVLHDAIEDQPRQKPGRVIGRRFGHRVAEMVEGLSDADVIPKPPWLDRKKTYFRRLEDEPLAVVKISAADKLHNARAILSDYIEVGEDLWTRFNIKDQGAVPQLWYLRSLLEIYERRLAERFTWELRAVVEELARRSSHDLETVPEPRQSGSGD